MHLCSARWWVWSRFKDFFKYFNTSKNYSRVQKSIENFVFRPKMAIWVSQIKPHPNSCLYPLLNYLGPDAIRSKCSYVQCADIHMCRDEGFSLTIVSKNERFHHDRFDGNGGNFAWNRIGFLLALILNHPVYAQLAYANVSI